MTAPESRYFRLNYLRQPEKIEDSQRARLRVKSVLEDCLQEYDSRFGKAYYSGDKSRQFKALVEAKLGIEYPYLGGGPYHKEFFKSCAVGDFLTAVTLIFDFVGDRRKPVVLSQLRAIFAEEDLRYRIEDDGAVHFLVDPEFVALTETTLAGLGSAKLKGVRNAVEEALEAFSPRKQSGKLMIRSIFEAVESLFLLIANSPDVNRLNKANIERHLKPILLDAYDSVSGGDDKVGRLLGTLEAWVHSAHPYRHGAPEEIHEAPIDEAILSASLGMSFVRFLAPLVK